MPGLILASSAVLGFILDLNMWQGITISVLAMGAYYTGRRITHE